MVNFLSSFLPNLPRLLIPIYDLQKKAKKFKWTEEAERVFNDIKKLLISPPVLKAPTPDGLFHLESDTSREGMGGTLLQKQGDEWVVIGYHSKRLPKSAKNFGVTELELTGLLVNIHGFMQLLCNRYFEVLVDHKAIEYMIKSKTESPMTRLKTLLLKLSEYMIDLKYQKGSEMHTSDALSRLHNFTDTPDQKDIIPLNFLQHFTPHYTEHLYSHLVENLYAHKTKTLDAIPVKQKHGRPPKPKSQILNSNPRTQTAAKNMTIRPQQHPRSLNNEIVTRQMINEINAEREKSDRLTVAKLNTVKQFNKQDYKSKLMTEKYSLFPLNSQQLTTIKWTEEARRVFNDIKKLLISPPVLKAPTPDGLFHLESDTSREGMGGTLLQKQGDEWVVIGYHSKRLPKSAKNFGITELELTGLLVNIHGFMQLLCNRYFEVLVDHKAIEYMIKSKTESPMTRLKTLLLKLSEYMIDLKYQKGSEMHTSDALSRLHNFTDTPDQKDIIPLNFLQHFTPHYTEHLYSHLVENLYAHKTKTLDTIPVKQKHGRPPKPKSQILNSNPRTQTAAKNMTIRPQQHPRSLNNEIVTKQMINEINAEREKSG